MEITYIKFLPKIQSLLGVFLFLFFAWALSENKSRFSFKSCLSLIIIQLIISIFILNFPFVESFFNFLNIGVQKIQDATEFGTSFVFGYLGGGNIPFSVENMEDTYILVFRALPLILVVSALSSLLFHFGILQFIIKVLSAFIQKISKIETVAAIVAAANIFIGMVESPLLVRPYLSSISRTGLFILMTTGMSTIAGTVFILYASILNEIVPNVIAHLIISSILSGISGVMVSLIIIPPKNSDEIKNITIEFQKFTNFMDAVVNGIKVGLNVLLSIVATLIVFLAIIYLLNSFLIYIPSPTNEEFSLQMILGILMAPIMWLTGLNWQEAIIAGNLMGIKTVLNELIAFISMSQLNEGDLSDRSKIITLYALCGFANFGSLGILISGLIAILPKRREEILELGFKSLVAGTLSTLITASVIGIVL